MIISVPSIPGWTAKFDGQFEIVAARSLNPNMKTQCLEVDAHVNDDYLQRVNLPKNDTYLLTLTWAKGNHVIDNHPNDAILAISWNKKVIRRYWATDRDAH